MKFSNIFKRRNKTDKARVSICSACGESHEEWPAITFESPDNYNSLSEEDKNTLAFIDTDFCIIEHIDQTDRFIRVTMKQKVIDCDRDLDYGLWVSLSKKNFEDYKANFNNSNHRMRYFGWLSNVPPEYELGEPIPTNVETKFGTTRPEIFPQESCEHLLVKDYLHGITKKEALSRLERTR